MYEKMSVNDCRINQRVYSITKGILKMMQDDNFVVSLKSTQP